MHISFIMSTVCRPRFFRFIGRLGSLIICGRRNVVQIIKSLGIFSEGFVKNDKKITVMFYMLINSKM